MDVYEVGGAVRDALLGRAVQDRDWVVVGATPQQLIDAGYTPVGRDFPVFLHPVTREEVALARTERKTAPGYHGFAFHAAPDVTLEQDLARRDLTINAIARAADGRLIDPHGGQRDLAARVLRHVSPAFAEDPVRILRLARFAARFPDFGVADATLALMRDMVAAGEADALVPERIWQELARGLMETRPSRMFEVLRACGALARVLPEVDRAWGQPLQPAAAEPRMAVLDLGAQFGAPLTVRYAGLVHDLDPDAARGGALLRDIGARLRVPNDCGELAELLARERDAVQRSADLGAAALVRLLERCDAWRKPARFDELLLACDCDARARHRDALPPQAPTPRLRAALDAARGVATADVAARAAAHGARGPAVGEAIHAARVAAVAAALGLPPEAPAA